MKEESGQGGNIILTEDNMMLLVQINRKIDAHSSEFAAAMKKREAFEMEQRAHMSSSLNAWQDLNNSFKAMVGILTDIRDKFFDTATGKRQVPLSVVMVIIGAFAAVMILQFLGDSKRNVKLGPIEITNIAEPQDDIPKTAH